MRITAWLIGFGAVIATSAGQEADATPQCKRYHASFDSVRFTAGCTSPFGLCTRGTLSRGNFHGTFTFTVRELALSAGLPSVPATTFSFLGDVVFDTGGGNITSSDVGILDQVRGLVSETHRITGGTGGWTGATGFLFGRAEASGPSAFTGDLEGQICLP